MKMLLIIIGLMMPFSSYAQKSETSNSDSLEYLIQIASLSSDTVSFENLKDLGQMYKVQTGNIGPFKYQLGIFESRSLARQFLFVARNRGYKDAFIVEQRKKTIKRSFDR